MNEKTTIEVAVHKITLMSGESVSDYAHELYEAGQMELERRLNLVAQDGCYMGEVFDAIAIFSICRPDQEPKLYAIKYERGADGKFKFGEITEVEREIEYEPVDTAKGCGGGGGKGKDWEKKAVDEEGEEELEAKKCFWANIL